MSPGYRVRDSRHGRGVTGVVGVQDIVGLGQENFSRRVLNEGAILRDLENAGAAEVKGQRN